MDFTKEQLSEVLCKHAERENGLQDLMEIMIESMMVAERREYLHEDGLPGDKGNGFRMSHTYGQGCTLTFRIPRYMIAAEWMYHPYHFEMYQS